MCLVGEAKSVVGFVVAFLVAIAGISSLSHSLHIPKSKTVFELGIDFEIGFVTVVEVGTVLDLLINKKDQRI